MGIYDTAKTQVSPAVWPLRGIAFVAARPLVFRGFILSAVLYAVVSAVTLAYTFSWFFTFQYDMLVRLVGPTWLAWQMASGLVLVEASVPLHVILQFRQNDLTNSLFKGVLKEVGIAQPGSLPASEAAEIADAGAAIRRRREAAFTGGAVALTAPLRILADLVLGRPGDSRVRSWVRLTATGPLLVFWPWGPAAYAWINGYGSGIAFHQEYLQAKGVADQEEQEAVTHSRAGQYRRFGAVVMALSLVPVVGWGLSVLSAAGAALWAAELEGSGGRQPARLFQGGTWEWGGPEYSLVEMEEARS